jgi:hypothetical protein
MQVFGESERSNDGAVLTRRAKGYVNVVKLCLSSRISIHSDFTSVEAEGSIDMHEREMDVKSPQQEERQIEDNTHDPIVSPI